MSIVRTSNRVTSDTQKFESLKKSDSSLIYTDAYIVEDFSIELTLGDRWNKNPSVEEHSLTSIEGGKIVIPPQTSIVTEAKEQLRVPNNLFGIIFTTGSILRGKGLFVGTGKIEPFFQGKLRLLLMNNTKFKIEIPQGTKLASAVFFRTETTVHGEPVSLPESNLPQNYRNFFKKVLKNIKGDKGLSAHLVIQLITGSVTATAILIIAKIIGAIK